MTRLEKFKKMIISQDAHIKITLGAIVGIILFIAGGIVYITDIQQNVNSNHQSVIVLNNHIEDVSDDVEVLQNDNVTLKISVAEINTKLTYINKSQIEIIQLLKESH